MAEAALNVCSSLRVNIKELDCGNVWEGGVKLFVGNSGFQSGYADLHLGQ